MLKKTVFQSLVGFLLGVVSWVVPMGTVFSVVAAVFGTVGAFRAKKDETKWFLAGVLGVLLGVSSRLVYAYNYQENILQAGGIAVVFLFLLAFAFLRRNRNLV